MTEIIKNDCQAEDGGDLLIRAEGRVRFLRDRGEIKTPELIEELKAQLTEAREIIALFLEDYPEDEEAEIRSGVARALEVEDASTLDITHPAVRRARAFLTKVTENKSLGQIAYEAFNAHKGYAIDWPLAKGFATEDMNAWEAAANAVIEECIQIVSSGVQWKPEENFSDKWRKASRQTSFHLADALRSLKGETDAPS